MFLQAEGNNKTMYRLQTIPLATTCVFLIAPVLLAVMSLIVFGSSFSEIFRSSNSDEILVSLFVNTVLVLSVLFISMILASHMLVDRIESGKLVRPFDYILLAPLVLGEVSMGAVVKIGSLFIGPRELLSGMEPLVQFLFHLLYFSIIIAKGASFFTLLDTRINEGSALAYCRSNGISGSELVSTIRPKILEKLGTSTILLTLILCVSSSAISAIGFKGSPGNGLEFWPQLLHRMSRASSSIAPDLATSTTASMLALVSIYGVLLAILLLRARHQLSNITGAYINQANALVVRVIARTLHALCIMLVFTMLFVPLLDAKALMKPGSSIYMLRDVTEGKIVFLIGALCLLVGIVSITIARITRNVEIFDSSRSRVSYKVIIPAVAVCAVLIPQYSTGFSISTIFLIAGLNNPTTDVFLWTFATTIFIFPIAYAFSRFVSNVTKNNKISYAISNRINWLEYTRIWTVREELPVLFVFGILLACIAWVSLPVASVFDRSLLTLSTIIYNLVEGRAASLQIASALLVVFSCLVILMLLLFGSIIRKIVDKQ